MKKQNAFLRLLCVLFATLMLVGMLSACNNTPDPTEPENPTELPTEGGDPTIPEGPTDGPENPTDGTGGNVDDPDSSIMDGDGHIEIDW